MVELTTIFIGDDENWDDFLRFNTVPENERDANGKPFKTLKEEELNALADFALANCQGTQRIFDYYFEVGSHRVAFGSRTWYYFLECAKTRKS